MNIYDVLIILIVTIITILCLRKLINNYKCMNKGGGCAGCALSGNCHKEQCKIKTIKKDIKI